ncbi:MAG: MFS transporter [Chloroflexi bacterium]|nr:MFS transporter [Chloroflexota bacterium]
MVMLKNQVTEMRLFRAWGNRPFALLWSGQALSRIGDHLYEVALAWWVLQKSGSAGMMATVLIFAFAPRVLFSLLGGVVVDRYPRLPLMIGSDVVRGITVVIISFLALSGNLELWHVFALSLIFGLVDAFFQPAFTATVPAIVPEEDLSSANSLTSFAIQGGRILGPPLGSGLIALGGVGLAFAFNGVTFFVSALFLLPLLRGEKQLLRHPSAQALPTQNRPNMLAEFKEGIQTVRQLPWLWISIALFAISNIMLAGPYSVAMPFLVSDVLKADVKTLGLLYSMFAVGYVLGGIWLGQKPRLRRRGLLIYGGSLVAGLMLLLFGLPVGLPVLVAAALINGAALEMGALAWTSILQDLVPRDKLGRVASVDMVGSLALLPIGFGLAGWATEMWGASTVFVMGGGVTAVLSFLAYQHPAIKNLD